MTYKCVYLAEGTSNMHKSIQEGGGPKIDDY